MQSHSTTDLFNILLRSLGGVTVVASLFLIIRAAAYAFLSTPARFEPKRRFTLLANTITLFALAYLARGPAERILGAVGRTISRLAFFIEPGWLERALVALYYTAASTLGLLALLQIIGILYHFAESRIQHTEYTIGIPGTHPRLLSTGLHFVNRLVRAALLVIVLLAYVPLVFSFFPATQMLVGATQNYLDRPAHDVVVAIVDYLPNLGYLLVIFALGWALFRANDVVFQALARGQVVFPAFHAEWADPTRRLVRGLLYAFVLMISFPYLPGANSKFFSGFSIFAGVLVTFGSSGAVGNLIAGVVLIYTRAFHVGEVVRIGEHIGEVIERSLIVTRIRTFVNEEITFPNGTVLAGAVVNYSARAGQEGLALRVTAGIGYDVDWRRVHALMIDAARATEHIRQEPAPWVLQIGLGDYAVQYELRAYTDAPLLLDLTYSLLRQKVLDAFNRAGVEIMTPSIFAHRDASDLAIPAEQFPERPIPHPFPVSVHNTEPPQNKK